ncbi:DHA2 family efflux MFS transporter permease subunit [Heliophilum fasciatum]|uniref:EmrB/QacA subfamily drug resistance transporter n=1 Tax=Heliophilum fasciatum TaxID=35700 RepID=A0A4R2RUY6_9FIRM|nr:DHA2 family efflux MFS transporter permease subunit [Heliophilum fasciatum]MCW2277301.1 EmrB/QacA subfamily drug resistance transporter [Heliophilum fasciatum]TCP67138.1 EmrB/QacA subfamily drug resistance transporter [Heliophilum fasciatum]
MTDGSTEATSKWLVLAVIVMGTFVTVLNNSLINVALPKLTAVFGSTTEKIQWVLTGYMLASALVVPPSAFLGDRYGYKKVFVGALTLFTLGSFLCGVAWNDTSLIVFRVLQGIGGGIVMPVSMVIIYRVIPRAEVGTAVGLWGVASMAAPAIGPTLGGYLVEIDWRLLFFIGVPIGLGAIFFSWILIQETPSNRELRWDLGGLVLSVTFFGSLLWALSRGQAEGWTSFFIVSLLFVAFCSLLLLIWVETGTERPLLELTLFTNPVFLLSTLSSSFVMVGLYGGMFLLPLYLQNVQGLTPLAAGNLLMPQSIAMALAMPISGKLFDKIGVVPLGLVGLGLVGITTYELHLLTTDTPFSWLDEVLILRGLGLGLCLMPLTTAGMNAVAPAMTGRASALGNVTRNVFGTMGIALFTTMLTDRQAFHNVRIAESLTVGSDVAQQALNMLSGGLVMLGGDGFNSSGGAGYVLSMMMAKEALSRAVADTFFASALPMFLALLVVPLLRKGKV